ncbi:methyltransferase [Ramlibacter algicola]|uniref:Methyltransferase n=1 Tax=Ramlibacter algicola TaxID=2795217 RepID=A0A934Q0B3_9BURK|nr:methyltransferase [Ramlibacter algicola]MBK0392446.1 methyltransferase [Ramlibacter algicola]
MNAPVDAGLLLTDALVAVGRWLQSTGYAFTTVTPATQARVNARADVAQARTLRDIFGWSRPFAAALLPEDVLEPMRGASLLEQRLGGLLRSRVRFSTLDGALYAHSAWPTEAADSVFFGPDTVRFAELIRSELQRRALPRHARIVDLGCGAGPGGLSALRLAPRGASLLLTDINPRALRFAAANAALANAEAVSFASGDLYEPVDGDLDLVVANPPYLNDPGERTYRHGGGRWGEALSVRIVRDGLERLAPGGRLVLYTGAAMVEGEDPLLRQLRAVLDRQAWPWQYRELDPDVFGEELEEPAYADVERIAAVALVVERPA